MRLTLFAVLLILVTLSGCESLRPTVKADNPVIGPPPPRIAKGESAGSGRKGEIASGSRSASGQNDDPSEIRTVGSSVNESVPILDDQVVARVNESPIFAHEVFEGARDYLNKIHAEVEKYKGTSRYAAAKSEERARQEELLRTALPELIERRILALAVRSSVKEAQYKQIEAAMEENYKQEERQRMKHKTINAATPAEFRDKLRALGYDPDQFRRTTDEMFLARAYFTINKRNPKDFGREDLLEYYHQHLKEYEYPEQVKWQQIQVREEGSKGAAAARERIDLAANELLDGTPFPEVARKYSDGLTASDGGLWDWMKRNTLADKELENRIFNMPVGEVSPVIESNGTLQIVVVLDRKEEGRKSFEEVQNEILKKLKIESERKMVEEIIEEARQDAVVWTMFDVTHRPLILKKYPFQKTHSGL